MRIWVAAISAMVGLVLPSGAALFLSGTSYTENFDGVGNGIPNGWSANTSATSTSVGTSSTFDGSKANWANSTGGFKNCASADGLSSTADSTAQGNSLDRTLAVRQTSGFGDPGAAFVLKIENTAGFGSFNLQLKAQMLDVSTRSTTWTFDYRIGESGTFTSLGTYTDPGVFGSTTISFGPASLASWNNQSSAVYFRVVALSDSTGSGSRDMLGIDDFSLTFTPVPEPAQWGLASAMGLLGICGLRAWRRSCLTQRVAPIPLTTFAPKS